MTTPTEPDRRHPSRGRLLRWGAALAGATVVVGVTAAVFPRGDRDALAGIPTAVARRGPLAITVVESGTVRPREQLVRRNELDDPATIISIVDEGTRVNKGDLMVELDVTARRKELVERRIKVQSAEAAVVFTTENQKIAASQGTADIEQAELAQEFAKTDLEQFLQGQFPKLVKEAEAKIAIAEEEFTRTQEHLNWSNTLFEEKYLSRTALQQDQLSTKKAGLAVELAKSDLTLLKTYTYERQNAQLQSNAKQTGLAVERVRQKVRASLAQADADIKAKSALLAEEQGELEETEDEVRKAKIYAPIDGVVLYASSVREDWDNDAQRIDEGAIVDERGEIVYLPTTSAYNVDVRVLEVNLRKLKPGQPVRITVDAMPGRAFAGRVVTIAQLPDPQSRYLNPNLKLYNTVIEIRDTDPALRNGMSCRAEIAVDQYPDAVHVPMQCVTRVAGRTTVYVAGPGGRVVPRRVEIGLDDGRFVHVRTGLEGGETVLLAPPLSSDDSADGRLEGPEGDPKPLKEKEPAAAGRPDGTG